MELSRLTFVLLAAVAALHPVQALSEVVSPRALCPAPETLAASPGEKRSVRGRHEFDAPAPQVALAPFAPLPASVRGAIRRVALPAGSRKLVALTFDLCEQRGEIAGYDGAIVDYLRANGIRATFFAGGKWMRSHGERTRQLMTDPLFEIGNHSEAHRNLRLLSGAALTEEITGPQRSYELARAALTADRCVATSADAARIPLRASLFRFPYGACNAASLAAVNDAGLLAIQWDLSTGDPTPGVSARAIARSLLSVKPGSIVIMHANGRGHHTAEALPLALPKLRQQGFEFVTVSELLAAGTPEVVPACYNVRPGDTDRYDRPLAARRAPGKSTLKLPWAP